MLNYTVAGDAIASMSWIDSIASEVTREREGRGETKKDKKKRRNEKRMALEWMNELSEVLILSDAAR